MKVLHILYQSLPQISGSSIRSRDILMSQAEIGLQVVAVTSPFQWALQEEENIDGIRYIRTATNQKESISDNRKAILTRILRFLKIFSFYTKLKKVVVDESPNVLHAHAMFFCGLPTIFLSKKFKIPFIYEVRSLWMLKKDEGNKRLFDEILESILFQVELYVMSKASVIIAINDNLKEELVQRKIDPNKIRVIKNAINTALINQLKEKGSMPEIFKSRYHFGYIGTLTPHEGIDLLIEAFEEVNSKYPKSKLYIFGNGIEEKRIEKKTKYVTNVEFQGSINPEDVYKAFNLIDIVVNPRYKNKLTDSVTPLKPLEAMAYEKFFIGSDVGGIKELVTDGINGLLFKAANKFNLIEKMTLAIVMDQSEKNDIKKRALEYVFKEKSWKANAYNYKRIYYSLLKS